MKIINWKFYIGALMAILLLMLFVFFDPSHYSFFPKCPFLKWTGLFCPGCGSQRAIHDLLRFDIASALDHNILVVVFTPVILLYLSNFGFKSRRVHDFLTSNTLLYSTLVLVVTYFVLRNLDISWLEYLKP